MPRPIFIVKGIDTLTNLKTKTRKCITFAREEERGPWERAWDTLDLDFVTS